MKTLLVSLFMLCASFGYGNGVFVDQDRSPEAGWKEQNESHDGDIPMVKHYRGYDSEGRTYSGDYNPVTGRTTIHTYDFGRNNNPAHIVTYIDDQN